MREPVLQFREVSIRRAGRLLVDTASFSVSGGELIALMGPSGSGKTTILRTIAGLDLLEHGSIVLDGLVLEGSARPVPALLRQTSRKVGLVFQFHCLFEHLSALKNVALAPVHAHRVPVPEAERRALELLAALGVEQRSHALPRELSGGEAQRVAIARALAVNPPLLLMDEPTASLDASRRAELGALLRRLTAEGRSVLIATHDDDFSHDWCNRTLRLENGVISDDGRGSKLEFMTEPSPAVEKTDEQWRRELTPEQFHVLREHGTERPGGSPLNKEKRAGTFCCAGCGQALFPSNTKFESGTGWPSFWEPLAAAVGTTVDQTHFMTRVEVHCARCQGHLGHVFPDGPPPTGQRYCMNGAALTFRPAEHQD